MSHIHDQPIRYDPNSVCYFPEEKLIGQLATASRWGNVPELKGDDIFNFFWDSGALAVYRSVNKAINEDIPEETMRGFFPLPSTHMHDPFLVGPSRVLVSQVLQLEKEYPELGTSAKCTAESWGSIGSDPKSLDRAYKAELTVECDPVFRALGNIGRLSAKSLYRFLDDFGKMFPDDGTPPKIEHLDRLIAWVEGLAYQMPEFINKRNAALARLQDLNLPEDVTPERLINGDYPLFSFVQWAVQSADYCKSDRDLCFLMLFNRYITIYTHLAASNIPGLQNSPHEVKADEIQLALAEKDARITELEAKLAELGATDTEPKIELRTHAASQARQEKTLNAWKPAIDAMIKVAVRCGEEGPVLRQQPDFNTMFNELDAVLIDAQMELFRKALPDEHIDRTGGPRGKGTPS